MYNIKVTYKAIVGNLNIDVDRCVEFKCVDSEQLILTLLAILENEGTRESPRAN